MKFDVVIGNPPYQMDRSGTRDKQIYPDFMDSAYDIGDKAILITPGRFLFNAGDTSVAWNRKMLDDPYLKVIDYEPKSMNVFDNTDIKGGVTITYRDSADKGTPIDVFIPHVHLQSIADKVWLIHGDDDDLSKISYSAASYRLSDIMHNENPTAFSMLSDGNEYQIVNNIFEKLSDVFHINVDDESDYVSILGRSRSEGRISRWILGKYIDTPNNFDKYKVFLPASNGSGALGEVLSTPLIGQPLVGHTQTFMSFGSFDDEVGANALMSYLKSKFARSLLGILKVTQHNPSKTWRYVPLQDFTENSDIDWTKSIPEIDQQLYKKYNLSDEEIEFIETHVKEME